jgi:hypothetical protein
MELRCSSKKHGTCDGGFVEVKCNSRYCGATNGVVVLHKFDSFTGNLIETKRYKNPGR